MALYPGEENEQRFQAKALKQDVARLFSACGMSDKDAFTVSDTLVHADLRGIHSHGVLRVPDYVGKLTRDGVDPRGVPEITSDKKGALVVDGQNSMGQVGGRFAMENAIERARDTGIAFAALGGSNHCGVMDYYTMMASDQNMVGIAGTNALPTMAPWGGVDKIVGLNPLSVAFPAREKPPLVMDIALGATAHGKIRIYAQKGEPIPEGWAFDKEGQPTTDATAALEGLIQPMGAFKGIGLAMVVGMMSTLFSGAGYGTESGNMVDGATSGADGQFFIAIDIAAFVEPETFKKRVDGIIHQFNTSTNAAGTDTLYVPGALENEIAARNLEMGVPLNQETIRGIQTQARELGVTLSLFPDA